MKEIGEKQRQTHVEKTCVLCGLGIWLKRFAEWIDVHYTVNVSEISMEPLATSVCVPYKCEQNNSFKNEQ